MRKLKKMDIVVFIIIFTFILIVVNPYQNPKSEESINYFPTDFNSSYKIINTSLNLLNKITDQYTIEWRVDSTLSRSAYLRQDIGFLFANGRLIGQIGATKQNTDQIIQKTNINGKDSMYFEAISYHFAEVHHPDEQILSAQNLSSDHLYVIHSQYSPLRSYRIASTKEDKEWSKVLNQLTKHELQRSWQNSMEHLEVDAGKYLVIPLTKVGKYLQEPFKGFTQKETNTIIGRLWESLYKHYVLGIKKKDGTVIDNLNSTIPLVLISKDKSHFLVIFETKENEPILLRQSIPTR